MAERKHLLLLSPFFHPEILGIGRFNGVIGRAMRAEGHAVTVVCSHPLYPDWKPAYSDAQLDGIRIIRGGLYMRYPGGQVVRRALLESWYALFTLYWLLRLRGRIDGLIAHFPPSLFYAVIAPLIPKRVLRIGIVSDLQYVYVASRKGPLGRLLKTAIRAVESFGLRRFDRLIFQSRAMRDYVAREYGLPLRHAVVQYPGVTLAAGEGDGPLAEIFAGEGLNVVYAGALGDKQNPLFLLRVFETLCERCPDVRCFIFSQGVNVEKMQTAARPALSDRVRFHPIQPEAHLAELYRRSDIQVVPQKLGTSEGSMPSKIPNIMSTYTHIFAITDPGSEVDQVLSRYPRACVVHSEELDVVVERLAACCERAARAGAPDEADKAATDAILENEFRVDAFIQKML